LSKPLTISIPHKLGKAGARARIETGFGRLEQQLSGGGQAKVDKSWDGDRLNFTAVAMGQTITGSLDILEDVVKMDIILPGFLGMLAGKVRDRVQKEGQLLLK
jgi:hypothetical protein